MAAEHGTLDNPDQHAENRAEARVTAWLEALSPALLDDRDSSASRGQTRPDILTGVRRDTEGFAFTRQLLESVSAGDPFAAALGLRAASKQVPPSLPAQERLALRAGGVASLGLPWAVLPVARRWLRDRVSHLVLSARSPSAATRAGQLGELREALRERESRGIGTVVQASGEPVLGPQAVESEIARLASLAAEPAVHRLAIDPIRLASGTDWSFDADIERISVLLRPVLEAARDHDTTLIFTPTDYRGARLAPELLLRAAADAVFDQLHLGVQLAAELPESAKAAERLIRWSKQRVAEGGAPIELAVVFGGFAARERIASVFSGLPVPTLDDREVQSAAWLRLVGFVCQAASGGGDGDATAAPPRAGIPELLPVVGAEDPHLLAAALELAEEYGLGDLIAVQLRAGTVDPLAEVLVAEGVAVRELLPLVSPKEFGGAIELILSLAAEAADPDSMLARSAALIDAARRPENEWNSALPALPALPALLADEAAGFRRAAAHAADPFPPSHRVQRRSREWDPSERDSALFYRPPADPERFDTGGLTAAVLGLTRDDTGGVVAEAAGQPLRLPAVSPSGFAAEPATDATVAENRVWVRERLRRAAELRDQAAPVEAAAVDPEAVIDSALTAGIPWRAQRAVERSIRLGRLALGTAAARDRFFEVLAAESGAPVPVIDVETNGAIDAARYLGQLTAGLGAIRGAEFHPDRLALVVAEAGVPLAERAEAVLAVLAAGSAVVFAVAPSGLRSSTVLIEEWGAAGLPEGLVGLIAAEGDAIVALAADPRIERALVLGSRSTARSLIRRRPDLRVEGRFREAGTVLISPTANPASAARDAVRSAFGGGPGDPRSARVVIAHGPAGRSRRLREQLGDAVRAIRVGDSARPGDADPLAFEWGPLPAPPDAAGVRALTELASGEEWLVKPEQLDDEGLLWRPGVRVGVRRDAAFWNDALGMPVIGLITAGTLDEALDLQHHLGGGGVAALHTGTAEELLPWLERSRAASLTVGRPTGPERVERLPGGGWGKAGMGLQPLAGGPNRLVALGSWQLREGTPSSTLHLRGLDPEVQVLIEAAQAVLDYASFDRVRRAALSDALSWRTTLGRMHDEIGLGVERNLLRHWPVAVQLRLAENGDLGGLIRVLAAGLLVRAPITVSTGVVLPREVAEILAVQGIPVSLEHDDAWLERLAVEHTAGVDAETREGGSGAAGESRVRLIDGDAVRTAEWLGGQSRVSVWAEPVTMAGPVELLVFLREQSISVTAHRYGLLAPPAGLEEWIAEVDDYAAPTR